MTDRYHNLDAMRGIAAIAVVLLHTGHNMHLPTLKHAYLAVDFFFMLSGFVLTRAYEPALRSSLPWRRFMEIRIVRLYPLFLLGILLGAVMVIGQMAAHSPHAMHPLLAMTGFVLNSLMLPATDVRDNLFPFDAPAWSLFLELIVNLAFAFLLCRMKSRWLALLTLASATLYLIGIVHVGHGSVGHKWPTFTLGLFRVFYGFPLGILLARASVALVKRPSMMALLGPVSLIGLLGLSMPTCPDWVLDAMVIFLAMPPLLLLAATFETPPALEALSNILGTISYPLYVVHVPLLQIVAFVFVRSLHIPAGLVGPPFLLGVFALSWFLAIKFDAPARAWLSRKLALRKPALQAP